MKINNQTKISAIIKFNKEAIETLVSVNHHFSKLRNPILRRVLAPRVTVEDAARIGKCSVAEILNKLSSIGFEIDNASPPKENVEILDFNADSTIKPEAGKVIVLDVRPILNSGSDPFNRILEELKSVPDGFVLEVINSFEPTPLIKILKGKGYQSFVKTIGEAVHTYFLKVPLQVKSELAKQVITKISPVEMEFRKEKFKNNYQEVDVRDMEMPLPMVTILNELESLKEGQALFVHHKKVPQYLLPELEERNFNVWVTEIEDGNVKLLIHK